MQPLFFCDFFYDSWDSPCPISAIISGGYGGMSPPPPPRCQWPPGHETFSKSESSQLLNLHKSSPLASREVGGRNRHVTFFTGTAPPTEKRNPTPPAVPQKSCWLHSGPMPLRLGRLCRAAETPTSCCAPAFWLSPWGISTTPQGWGRRCVVEPLISDQII